MVRYDQRVLNKLLDTYENSRLAIGENKRTVNIELAFTKKVIPEYFDESSMEYVDIHESMKNLEDKNNKLQYENLCQKLIIIGSNGNIIKNAYNRKGQIL